MPPKFRYTKEEITRAALDIVREDGMDALRARTLAARLNASPKVIFGAFAGMDEVADAVLHEAYALYQNYLATDMAAGEYPPYKASGMAYIRFAREEKELFRLLFMRDRTGESIAEDRESVRPLLRMLQKKLSLTEDEAYRFHMESWIFVHGIATMVATSYLAWDTDFISRALSDMYRGLTAVYTEKKGDDAQ